MLEEQYVISRSGAQGGGLVFRSVLSRGLPWGGFVVALALAGCGGQEGAGGDGGGPFGDDGGLSDDGAEPFGDGGEPSEASGQSSYRVSSLCKVTETEENNLVPLTKAELIELLGDQFIDWMTPIHGALTNVNDVGIFDAFAELLSVAVSKSCRAETNYDVFSPSQSLTDASEQARIRGEVVGFLDSAVEISSGEVLRLSFHECSCSSEAIGQTPLFFNVRRTTSGKLLFELELTEGAAWTKKVTISPNELTIQANLETLTDWARTASAAAREGRTEYSRSRGTVTVGLRRDAQGNMSGSVGVRGLRFQPNEDKPEQVVDSKSEGCTGFEFQVGPRSVGSSYSVQLGTLDVTAPGSSFCHEGSMDCGDKERTGPFHFALPDSAFRLTQAPEASAELFSLDVQTRGPLSASVAADRVAEGGLGRAGEGGKTTAQVSRSPEGFLLTFSPALDMGAALMISNFSDQMRMSLPDWLTDEIFDLTFGGDPVASIVVPYRELCAPGSSTAQSRRELEITNGTLEIHADERVMSASAGQCVGESLADSSTYQRTSDFWDIGFACTP